MSSVSAGALGSTFSGAEVEDGALLCPWDRRPEEAKTPGELEDYFESRALRRATAFVRKLPFELCTAEVRASRISGRSSRNFE